MAIEYIQTKDFDIISVTCGHYNSYPECTNINVQPWMVNHYEVDFL